MENDINLINSIKKQQAIKRMAHVKAIWNPYDEAVWFK